MLSQEHPEKHLTKYLGTEAQSPWQIKLTITENNPTYFTGLFLRMKSRRIKDLEAGVQLKLVAWMNFLSSSSVPGGVGVEDEENTAPAPKELSLVGTEMGE